MKPRLLVNLLLCAILLTACYRQTEEPFQQAEGAEVAVAATPTSIEAVVEDGAVAADEEAEASPETRQYVTPEAAPGQVDQPTAEPLTAIPITATPLAETLTPFIPPTATVAFAEELDPNHECVYTVQAGDNLFRLSLNWNTTVREIMDATQIDSEALAIGQLLLRPGCEYAPATARPTVLPAPALGGTEAPEATSARPQIHVVSAGDTIESISLKYRVDVKELIDLNNLANPNRLAIGQELRLPD